MRKKDITKILVKDEEYLKIVAPILSSLEFQKRKNWIHHENCSLYEHCLVVSYLSYRICKKRKWNYTDAAIGGLLHDFYKEPWQDHLHEKIPFFKQHSATRFTQSLK